MSQGVNLQITSDGGVAVIAFNRPPVNALSHALMEELGEALRMSTADPSARVIVVTSALPGIFSAGADIKEVAGLDVAAYLAFIEMGHHICDYIEALPKPVVAAVGGTAFGGGCELVLACDLRISGESARFALPEVNLGLVPGWGGTQRMPRLVGKTIAMAMAMTGEPISAREALTFGLVNTVVPDDALLEEATTLAQRLAAKPPISLANIKRAVQRGLGLSFADGLAIEKAAFLEASGSNDAREGVQAFMSKRPARFTGT